MTELILTEIKLHRESETLKQELEASKGYDRNNCYKYIDDCCMNYIYVKNLERFFNCMRRKTTE
jgi:hypothetical protein